MKKIDFLLVLMCAFFVFQISATAQTVVISQFFGGAGSTTSPYTRDYVELLNVSAVPQSLNGLAIQYGGATGNLGAASNLIYPLQNVTLQPGQYYLVGLTTSTGIAGLPTTVDNTTTNTINMSGTQGKVALTNTTTALACGATATPCTLPDSRIIDLAAWGGSNNAEGGASVNNGVNITALQGGVRKLNGCQDTNNNNADFDVVTSPVPRNSASTFNPCVAGSNIDLTISRTADQTTINLNDMVTYTLTVSNGGTSTATNVRATFVVPSGLSYGTSTVSGGFTVSESGGTVTFDGGTVPNGGSVTLTVTGIALTEGVNAVSATTGVTVDPNNTIAETDETNNNATDSVSVAVRFPSIVTGLFGRSSLAQLMADIQTIGGANTVVLDSNLANENANILVPDGLTLDFGSNVVTGTGGLVFGQFCTILTSHPNGIGDVEHPGNIQLTGEIGIFDNTSFTYYSNLQQKSEFGTVGQTAYGMPEIIYNFRIENPDGVTILAPFSVLNDFYLTNGIVRNGSNTITLSETSRINGENFGEGSETSFVAGRMTKFLPTFVLNGLATSFVFPVGTINGQDNGYSPLRAQSYFASEAESSLTVEAFDANLPGLSTPTISRYWQITETGSITTDLIFNWRTGEDSEIVVPADLRVFRGTVNACTSDLSNCVIDTEKRFARISGVTEFSPWGIAEFVPAAANVGIKGRVSDRFGNGLRNAEVTVREASGRIFTARTNSFGFYEVTDLEVGETYIVTVEAKQQTFQPRVLTIEDNITNVDFISIE